MVEAALTSRRRLEQLFKTTLGRGIHAEIQRVRIERAKRLLNGTNLPVAAVAAECGFGSPARFSTAFRRTVGTQPVAYRMQITDG